MTVPPDPGPPASSEDARVEEVLALLGGGKGLRVGPGHDCAAVEVGEEPVAVTTDVVVDGVHFDLATCGGEAAAAKALLVNLSDLAAAAAAPLAFEVGVVLPRSSDPDLLRDVARGLAGVAKAHACPCAGGDTNVADGPLVIAVTVLGRPGPWGLLTRAGARPGDRLSVTGPLGGAPRGRHLRPVPRLAEARTLARAGIPRAQMDLSDGLSTDLPRLCRASGVGARLDAERIPVHADARAVADERSPLEHALHDGEDFELLLAHAPLEPDALAALEREGVRLYEIGRVVEAAEGIRLHLGGASLPLAPGGYDHFRPPR